MIYYLFSLWFLIALSACNKQSGGSGNSLDAINLVPKFAGVMPSLIQRNNKSISKPFEKMNLSPSIEIKVNANRYYDNGKVDSQLLNQVIGNLFSGFSSSNDPLEPNTQLTYDILPDGHGHSIRTNVSIIRNDLGGIEFIGTFEGVDFGTSDQTKPSFNYFKLTVNSDETFTFEQILYLNEYVVDDFDVIGNGWQWYAHTTLRQSSIGRVQDAVTFDNDGYTLFQQQPTSGGFLNNSSTGTYRYFALMGKQRENKYGIALKSYMPSGWGLPPTDIISQKNSGIYDTQSMGIEHGTDKQVDGYLISEINTENFFSTFLAGMPAWVSTWWDENP